LGGKLGKSLVSMSKLVKIGLNWSKLVRIWTFWFSGRQFSVLWGKNWSKI